jgi:hypothetical protein
MPVAYMLIGAWMIYFGFTLRPEISAAVVATLVIGAVVYYVRLRTRRV